MTESEELIELRAWAAGRKGVEEYLSLKRKYDLNQQQLDAERAKVAKLECLYRWRPITEIHEDYGPCVCVHLIDDPCYLEIHWSNETEFDETAWTHFAQVPKLLTVDAERLIEEYRSAAPLQAPEVK